MSTKDKNSKKQGEKEMEVETRRKGNGSGNQRAVHQPVHRLWVQESPTSPT